MVSLFHLENRKPMQITNESTVHWTESSTNSAAVYAFHMSDIFTDIDGKSRNDPISDDSQLLPESQAKYYSMVVVLVLAGLFFGFTLTVTIAVGVFCRKKNTVFVFQKAEQDDAGYEMRGNDTEEDEDGEEKEDKEDEGGRDDEWLNGKEEEEFGGVNTGSTSIVSNASDPLFGSVDSSDEFQTQVRHKSLDVLDRRSTRAPRSSGNLDDCFVIPPHKRLTEAKVTADVLDREFHQVVVDVMKKSPMDGDPLFYRSQDSLDSSMDSSENTVIEVTSGGQFLSFRSSKGVACDQANEDDDLSSTRGFSDDDDYSADEEDEEETLENSFLCHYDSSAFKPEMGVLLPDRKSQNRRQGQLSPVACVRQPEVRHLLHDVTIISPGSNFRRVDKIGDDGNFVIPQL